MRCATDADLPAILQCLKKNISACVYLYIDIVKYGVCQDFLRVWVNDQDVLTTVVMKYYDSLQVYALETGAEIDGIISVILQENVRMISGEKYLIEQIYGHEEIAEKYDSKDGYVFCFNQYRKFPYNGICMANPEDAEEIAKLICLDEDFSQNYRWEILAEQLRERMVTGFGRSLIFRKENRIVAHIATYAETAGIAVTSGLIVHPEYRGYQYGIMIESYLVNMLKEEGFSIFTLVNDRKRVKLLRAMKEEECGMYMKLVKDK